MRFVNSNAVKLFCFLVLIFICGLQQIHSQRSIASANIQYEFTSKKVSGSIGGFKSVSTYYPDRVSDSSFEGTVTVESIKTGNFLRDWSLKGGKYFDEDDYPLISFKSTAVSKAPDGIKVDGILSIKGSSKPVTIYFVEAANTLTGALNLNTVDYGIKIKKNKTDNAVKVKFQFVLN